MFYEHHTCIDRFTQFIANNKPILTFIHVHVTIRVQEYIAYRHISHSFKCKGKGMAMIASVMSPKLCKPNRVLPLLTLIGSL